MADETKQEAAPVDLTAARARHAAATPGPWRWYGNTETRTVYLATAHSGRYHVLGFRRWGMRGAQPEFQIYDRYEGPVRDRGSHGMVAFADLEARAGADRGPGFDVAVPRYRHDFVGVGHPDAALIEHGWEDLRAAFAEVDRLAGWNLALRTRLEQLARTALKAYEELHRVSVFDGLSVEGSESLSLVGLYDKLDEGGDLLGPFAPPSEVASLRWKVAAADRSASEEKARADRAEAEAARCRDASIGAAREHAEGVAEVVRQLRLAESENAALRSKPFEADGLPPYAEIAAAYEKGYGIRERAENHADLRNGLEAAVDLATERLRCRLGALAFDLEVLAAEGGSAADLVEKMRARGHLP
jgi:hypothetical protein